MLLLGKLSQASPQMKGCVEQDVKTLLSICPSPHPRPIASLFN